MLMLCRCQLICSASFEYYVIPLGGLEPLEALINEECLGESGVLSEAAGRFVSAVGIAIPKRLLKDSSKAPEGSSASFSTLANRVLRTVVGSV